MISYRRLASIDDMHTASDFVQTVWGEEAFVNPFLLLAQSSNGAILLGAFQGEELIGLNYGFIGLKQNESYLYSHMLAVQEAFRSSGVGESLKHMQMREARNVGLSKLIWTFDPLQSKNAYFNFHKLQAVSTTYVPHYYGVMNNELNGGTATDRLIVECSTSVKETRTENLSFTPIDHDIKVESDMPILLSFKTISCNRIGLPVPGDIQLMKKKMLKEALHWQSSLKELFNYYLEQSFEIVDFQYEKNRAYHYYILEKKVIK